MKITKVIASATIAALMATSLVACATTKETEATAESNASAAESTEEASANSDIYFELNGVNIVIGESFDDIKDDLGATIKPDEEIMPCTGEQVPLSINHFYQGLTIGTTADGIICEAYANPWGETVGDATFCGSITKGDDMSAVSDMLGEPAEQGDGYMSYNFGNMQVMFNSEDDDFNTLASWSMYDMTLIYGEAE